MLAELTVKGSEIDHREGSYANTLVSVAAYQLYKLYQLYQLSPACCPWSSRMKTLGSTSTKTRPSWA